MGKSSKEVGNREITVDEVAKHNTATSLWIIYNDKVLDLTEFLNEHPGGDQVRVHKLFLKCSTTSLGEGRGKWLLLE